MASLRLASFAAARISVAIACAALLSSATALAQNDPTPPAVVPATPGWLGVVLGDDEGGVRVRRVLPDSPAERDGLRPGMRIDAIDDVPVSSSNEFVALVGSRYAGLEVRLRVVYPEPATLHVVLGPRPAEPLDVASRLAGRTAPASTAQLLGDETTVDLAEATGRIRIVEFWATWCGPCTVSLPRLRSLHEHYGPTRLEIVSVTDEPAETVRRHLERHPMPWVVALDTDESATGAWWVLSYPTFFLVDASGRVVSVYSGIDQLDAMEREIARLAGERAEP
jgi:thiol-disulfide isomerase/thioredoxin